MTAPATVRRFSMAGPCIELGRFVKRTDKFLVYIDHRGATKRIAHRDDLAHVEACSSCRDHRNSQYPDGYMD